VTDTDSEFETLMESKPELYQRLAKYYDKIYHWKDYKKEAKIIKGLIQTYKKTSRNLLLDVGCGTGEHIRHIKVEAFRCVGLDASKYMIAVERKKKIKGVKFLTADMTNFSLGMQFDVITCLFSSIGYLKSLEQIEKAVSNFARHLKAEGILLIEPWIKKSELKSAIHLQTYEDASLKIARVTSVKTEGDFTILDDRYLIGEKNKGVSYLKDLHKLRFVNPEEMLNMVKKEGVDETFSNKKLLSDRGLFIGVKLSNSNYLTRS
jgi:ubiquinone/menaquinone biosynthesis C-methylase UbiE